MSDLLATAIKAHGGIDRWNEFSTLRAELSIAGAIWEVKRQPGLLTNKVFEIQTREERLTITPFSNPRMRAVFVPNRQVLETLEGKTVETRYNPKAAFAGHTRETPWDKFHVAYFASEADFPIQDGQCLSREIRDGLRRGRYRPSRIGTQDRAPARSERTELRRR